MRSGNLLVIDVGVTKPDFKKEFTSDFNIFPSDLIFDFDKWRDDKNYMKVVRDEENKDLSGYEGQYV